MLVQYSCANEQEERVKNILIQSFELRTTDLQQSKAIALDVLAQCPENHILHAYGQAYLGYYDMIQSNYDDALPRVMAAEKIFLSEDATHGIGFTQSTLGSINIRVGDYHLGLRHLLTSIDKFRLCGNLEGEARSLRLIGMVHESFGDFAKAEDNFRICIKIGQQIDNKNETSNACNTLSSILLKTGKAKEARKYAEMSIDLKEQSNDRRGLGFAYYGLAKVCLVDKDYDSTEDLLNKSLEIHQKFGDQIGQMMTLNKLGILFDRIERSGDAKASFLDCIRLGEFTGHNLIMQKSYYGLYLIEKGAGNFDQACQYIDLHLKYKKKVVDAETQKMIHSLQAISDLELLEKKTRWQKEVNAKIKFRNKELDSFLYKITHDLRGPISSLMGLRDLVAYEISDQKSKEYFGIYDAQIQKLNATLTDFMNIIQTKDMKLESKILSFEGLVQDCLDAFKFHEHYDKIAFNLQIATGLGFESDRRTVKSILQNLIENAIKYCRVDADPMVNVNIHRSGEQLMIIVKDNGLGIKESEQEKIFDMFYRTQNKMQGTGLGLFILKEAVQKLRGTINLQSKLGQGSTFEVLLPFIRL